MAKAPGTADTFDGSGQVWFKILDIGPTFDASGTATWNLLRASPLSRLNPTANIIPQKRTHTQSHPHSRTETTSSASNSSASTIPTQREFLNSTSNARKSRSREVEAEHLVHSSLSLASLTGPSQATSWTSTQISTTTLFRALQSGAANLLLEARPLRLARRQLRVLHQRRPL